MVNARATYDAETHAWVDDLVDDLGQTDIALLLQDDGFGRVGLAGVKDALAAEGWQPGQTGRGFCGWVTERVG